MGLDAVELLIAVEEEFGVSLPDDEAAALRTLGDLHDYLLETCEGRRRPDCPTRSAFYRLRCAMGVVLHIDPRSLRPTTPVLPLLGRWRRHRQWNRLKRELAMELPPLESRAAAGVFWGMCVAAMVCFAVAAVFTHDPFVAFAAALSALLPGVLLGYIVGVCWIPTIRDSHGTLGGLARALAAFNAPAFRVSEEPSTENDPIWDRLSDVVVRQFCVRRETLRRETRFVEDLGV